MVFPAEIGISSGFSGRKQVISKKKRSSSQKRHKLRCKSTKNTNLDLDLRFRSPEPDNSFGAQSSLGGAQFSFGGHKQSVGGSRPRYAPPWRRVCQGITCLVSVAIYCTRFLITIHLHVASFYVQNTI